jgi:hypothetical protein
MLALCETVGMEKKGIKGKPNPPKKPLPPGPEAERLKLEGNWKDNVRTALGKKRPKDGWPKE